MSRDVTRCPYWESAQRTAALLVFKLELVPSVRAALQEGIARALCDAWETGVQEQRSDADTITEAIGDLKPEDFDA